MHHLSDAFVDEIYTAGQHAEAGTYREVGTRREVVLEEAGTLPPSLNGRVACYVRLHYRWSEHESKRAGAENISPTAE